MINLSTIIVIAAWLSVPLSIWGFFYFLARIITNYKIRRHLGDMPTADEISRMYEHMNEGKPYYYSRERHSPTEKNLRS